MNQKSLDKKNKVKQCDNCQSNNSNITITTNNTCAVCGRDLTEKDYTNMKLLTLEKSNDTFRQKLNMSQGGKVKGILNREGLNSQPTAKGSPNIYRDIDEEFEYCKNTFAFESDDGFILGEDGIVYDMNRVLDFIHKQIDKTNREWEKRIRQLLDKQKPVQYQDDNGFGWAIPCKSLFESFKEIFNNLLKHKEIK